MTHMLPAPIRHLLPALGLRLLFAVLVAVLAVPAIAHAESAGFAVQPLLVEADVDPGKSVKQTLTVTNTTSTRQTFAVGKEDIAGSRKDAYSSPVLLGGKVNSPISGYDWIDGLPGSVTIGPGESENVQLTVAAPSNATGGHYAAVTFTTGTTDIGDVDVRSRVAVLFLMNAGGVPPPEIVIEDVTVRENGKTVVDYVNGGEKTVRPKATVTYVDAITGKTVATRNAEECTMALPGAMGRCEIEALGKDARDGTLLTRPKVTLTNGLGRTAKAELPVEWSGNWSAMILPIVGFVLLLLFVLRRRRREPEEEELFEF